jgi:RNase adapter protein RapZ
MGLIIISGRSGSGKSTALHVLEDVGFTCIDNLPASLLPTLTERITTNDEKPYAVSIDARNSESDIERLPEILQAPAIISLDHQIIYLDADDDVLLQRFSETRRRHPLSDKNTDLREAIIKEKKLLKPIIELATITIDTSDMGFHDLRDLVKHHVMALDNPGVSVLFQSFGFKYGLPRDADLVFDVRCLPNPHWKNELRSLTGNDQGVIDFLESESEVSAMYNDICHFLSRWLPSYEANNRSYITVAIGCTGGQHRSVYLCNQLTQHFRQTMSDVQCRHRELRL